ncbi:MAG: phage tail family protein [Firmicutes bacterium]|nr:phage tail family protein [Bacillota bacterium]
MEQITIINSKGENITLGHGKPYLLQSLSGTGSVEGDIHMEKAPFQDGETYINTLIDTRALTIEAAILVDTHEELLEKKSKLARVLNPKDGKGTLKYEYQGLSREIEIVVDSAPVFPVGSENKGIGFQRTTFTLICPSPFWTDSFYESEGMADWIGGLTFPLSLGTTFAERGKTRIFNNAGDVPTPVEIVFYGQCENPIIENISTGEFIKVNKLIDTDEKLVITTDFGNKSVEVEDSQGNRTNAFNYIDLNSSFFHLKSGENLIEYSADGGEEETKVLVKWKNRYLNA